MQAGKTKAGCPNSSFGSRNVVPFTKVLLNVRNWCERLRGGTTKYAVPLRVSCTSSYCQLSHHAKELVTVDVVVLRLQEF